MNNLMQFNGSVCLPQWPHSAIPLSAGESMASASKDRVWWLAGSFEKIIFLYSKKYFTGQSIVAKKRVRVKKTHSRPVKEKKQKNKKKHKTFDPKRERKMENSQ